MIFETELFLVRRVTLEDVQGYLSFWNDPVAMKFIGDGTWGGGEDIVSMVLEENMTFYKDHEGLGFWAVVDKQSGQVVGEAGLGILHSTKEIEAGFLLSRPFWGRGLGTQLCQGLLEYGFKTLACQKIVAVAHPENKASIRILQKCGMRFEGEIFDRGVHVLKFRKLV